MKKPRLMSRKCDTCIFRPGNKMHLDQGRLESLEKQNMEKDLGGGLRGTTITCHETLPFYGKIEPATCRGFYDRNRDSENFCLMLGDRVLGWELVDPVSPMAEWLATTSFTGDLELDENGLPEVEDDD